MRVCSRRIDGADELYLEDFMRRKQGRVLHFAGTLLLSGVIAGQLAGILPDGEIRKAIGNAMSGGAFLLADGPCPGPPGPPLRVRRGLPATS